MNQVKLRVVCIVKARDYAAFEDLATQSGIKVEEAEVIQCNSESSSAVTRTPHTKNSLTDAVYEEMVAAFAGVKGLNLSKAPYLQAIVSSSDLPHSITTWRRVRDAYLDGVLNYSKYKSYLAQCREDNRRLKQFTDSTQVNE